MMTPKAAECRLLCSVLFLPGRRGWAAGSYALPEREYAQARPLGVVLPSYLPPRQMCG